MPESYTPDARVDLVNLDLNLLVAFDALVVARSVSAAALRLGITQPAMSKRLAKLRKLLRDDILVRTAEGMQLTDRALDLAEPIQGALRQIETTLCNNRDFQPSQLARTFRIATTDSVAVTLLPPLINRLQTIAPGISLVLRTMHRGELVDALNTSKIDMAITVLPDAPPIIKRQLLFEERFVCLVAANHPEIQKTISLEQYVAYPHVLVTYTADLEGLIDRILYERGLKRRVIASFPYHLVAPTVVAKTDCIVTLPERTVKNYMDHGAGTQIQILSLPLELAPYRETLLWHRRDERDLTHQWLRGQIRQLAVAIDRE